MSSTPKFRRENSGAERSAHAAAFRSKRSRRCSAGSCSIARPGTTSATWSRPSISSGPTTQLIFESIAALAGEAQPCDPVTVSEHLQRLGKLNDAGGLAYLGTLTRDTPGAANARAYAEIVKERALLRELVSAGGEIASSVWSEEGESARDLVEKAERRIFAIAEGSRARQGLRERAGRRCRRSIDQIDDLYNNPNKPRGLPTGFIDFDSKTGGLRPGDLVIVAGGPRWAKRRSP